MPCNIMDTKFARRTERIGRTTCSYWRAGKCNRNPCRFVHIETPSPPAACGYGNTAYSYGKKPHSSSENTPKYGSKKALLRDNGDRGDATRVAKAFKKSSPRICKYWINNNCVHGEQCLYLHSWFRGDGFSTVTKLQEHKKVITGIALPVGSDKLYSGSTDGTVRIWDCHTGQCAKVINLGAEVTSLISEGSWIFVGLQNAVKAWNIQTMSEFTLDGPKGRVRAMTVGNNTLFAGAEDGVIFAWRGSSKADSPFELVASLTGHTKAVVCLAVGCKMLYSGSMDQSIKVWDMDTLQCTMTLNDHTDAVTSLICWDQYLLSSSSDRTIKVWACIEAGSLEVIYTHTEENGVVSLFGMPDAEGKPILFSSCRDNSVHMYELPSFSERGRLFAKKDVALIELGPGGLFFTGDESESLMTLLIRVKLLVFDPSLQWVLIWMLLIFLDQHSFVAVHHLLYDCYFGNGKFGSQKNIMDTKFARRTERIGSTTCSYWRAGRCNRNRCRFLHIETPSPPAACGYGNTAYSYGKKPHSSSENTPKYGSKKALLGDNGDRGDATRVAKAFKKSSPRICKYWINNNCVHGEQCLYLHSWFRGDGFSTVTKLHEHKKVITGIALPVGSDKLYSGSTDGTVRIWDCHTGQCAKVINLGAEVTSLISEGSWIFVGLQNAVKAWNIQTMSEFNLDGPKGRVRAMTVGNNTLFAGAEDGVIFAWRGSSKADSPFELVASLTGHTKAVVCLAVGCKMMYSGSMDQSIKVWDMDTLQCTMTLNDHTDVVTSLICWDQYLLSSSSDRTIKVWACIEAGSLEVIYTHTEENFARRTERIGRTTCSYWRAGKCNRNPCRFLHIETPSPPAACGYGNTAYSYGKKPHSSSENTPKYGSKKALLRDNGDRGDATRVAKAFKKSSPRICKYWINNNCVHGEQCLYLHSWFRGDGFSTVTKLQEHKKVITGIALPVGSDKLYSGSTDGTVRIWDCHTGQCAKVINLGAEVTSLISEGSWIFVGLQNAVKAWNIQTMSEFTLDGPKGRVRAMTVGNNTLFAGAEDGVIFAWRGSSKANSPFELVASLTGHTKAVVCLAVGCKMLYSGSMDQSIKGVVSLFGMPDAEGKPILFSSCRDNSVHMYELPSFSERGRLFAKKDVALIELGPGGLFFTGDESGFLMVWKWLEKYQFHSFIFFPADVIFSCFDKYITIVITGIALPVGSDKLYSGSTDGTVRIWDCHTGQCAKVINLGAEVTSLISEGSWIFVGLQNAVKVWDMDTLQCTMTLNDHTDIVTSLICWDQYLLSSSSDRTIKVWACIEAGSLEVIYTHTEENGVVSLFGMPDAEGKPILFSSCRDNSVHMYELPSYPWWHPLDMCFLSTEMVGENPNRGASVTLPRRFREQIREDFPSFFTVLRSFFEKKSISMNLGSMIEREEKRLVYRVRCSSDENNEEEEMEEGIGVCFSERENLILLLGFVMDDLRESMFYPTSFISVKFSALPRCKYRVSRLGFLSIYLLSGVKLLVFDPSLQWVLILMLLIFLDQHSFVAVHHLLYDCYFGNGKFGSQKNIMDTKFARRTERIGRTTCSYWRAGKCNRNPCRFVHIETPSPPAACGYGNTAYSYGKKPHSSSENTPKYGSKKALLRDNGDRGDATRVAKAFKKSSPRICKYWINNNCVHGEQCLYLHSWFRGDGFSTVTKLQEHKKVITGIAIPVGSDKLYSGSTDGTVRIWDCHTGQCAKVINLGAEVTSLISEGSWIFVGLQNAVKAWNIQTMSEFTLDGPKGRVRAMTVGNNTLFAGAEDGVIFAWRGCSKADSPFELVASLTGHTKAVVCLAVGCKMLYSGSMDQSIKVWDMDTLQCTMTLNDHTDAVTSLICWDQYLLSSSSDRTIKVWACIEAGSLEVIYTHTEENGVVSLFGMPDAEGKPILFSSCRDNSVHMYELPSFSERGRLFAKKDVALIELGPGGLFFTGDESGLLMVWKWLEVPKVASS
ncbi:Zinc finger CCCH domain-containing protein 48 [Glycine soja]